MKELDPYLKTLGQKDNETPYFLDYEGRTLHNGDYGKDFFAWKEADKIESYRSIYEKLGEFEHKERLARSKNFYWEGRDARVTRNRIMWALSYSFSWQSMRDTNNTPPFINSYRLGLQNMKVSSKERAKMLQSFNDSKKLEKMWEIARTAKDRQNTDLKLRNFIKKELKI